MKQIRRLLIALALLGTTGLAFADQGPRDHDRRSQGHADRDYRHGGHHGNRRHHDDRRYDNRRRHGNRHHGYSHVRPAYRHARWERGHRYHGPSYMVRDYRHYRLRSAPRGYHWIRANNEYLLVAIATGVIVDLALR